MPPPTIKPALAGWLELPTSTAPQDGDGDISCPQRTLREALLKWQVRGLAKEGHHLLLLGVSAHLVPSEAGYTIVCIVRI